MLLVPWKIEPEPGGVKSLKLKGIKRDEKTSGKG